MESSAVSMLIMGWQGKIPQESMLGVEAKLQNIPDDKVSRLASIPLKSPILALVLSLFFGAFGVDRFYKGDIGLGILKFIATCFVIGIIWVWIDWFCVYKGIKQDNLKKIQDVIYTLG